ncbi:MAG: thiamine phosphate synthase [Proteobacteria bacterium]|nr:thiamine phosphate synthase [Pseudomonadota bacterium]
MSENSFPTLYPIVNISLSDSKLAYIESLLKLKVGILQIRAKNLPEETFLDICDTTLKFRNRLHPECLIVVNDNIDICLKLNLDGVHLGQGDCKPTEARRRLGPQKIIGYSTHNLEQLRSAPADTLNYLAIGPIFKTTTKANAEESIGLSKLREMIQLFENKNKLPLVAIGGINNSNAKEVIACGINSLAMISELEEAADLENTVAYFRFCKAKTK